MISKFIGTFVFGGLDVRYVLLRKRSPRPEIATLVAPLAITWVFECQTAQAPSSLLLSLFKPKPSKENAQAFAPRIVKRSGRAAHARVQASSRSAMALPPGGICV